MVNIIIYYNLTMLYNFLKINYELKKKSSFKVFNNIVGNINIIQQNKY